MTRTKTINCANDFYESRFNEVCEALEQGETVGVYIDCIGHTRNNMAQEVYKEHLQKKYGDKLTIERSSGAYSYSYTYTLKK